MRLRIEDLLKAPAIENKLEPIGTHSATFSEDVRKFYLDIAMSTSRTQRTGLLEMTTPDKILFRSDWPYAPEENILYNQDC